MFFFLNIVRLRDIKENMFFSIKDALTDCFVPCIIVSLTSFIVPVIISFLWEQSLTRFFSMVFISILWTSYCCAIWGLTSEERDFFKDKIHKTIKTGFHK